ncbi:hypothetical protein HU200_000543 [Digitaria exilis]|uniref:Strictosidine synthase conserved region domain-containing protein n=1 Tax=Digitaria exilis TaxID=1010633 RepID=A0A835G2K2_9POAL|nr:hypothetical protein HU200_000543 [Digitaria exilis]
MPRFHVVYTVHCHPITFLRVRLGRDDDLKWQRAYHKGDATQRGEKRRGVLERGIQRRPARQTKTRWAPIAPMQWGPIARCASQPGQATPRQQAPSSPIHFAEPAAISSPAQKNQPPGGTHRLYPPGLRLAAATVRAAAGAPPPPPPAMLPLARALRSLGPVAAAREGPLLAWLSSSRSASSSTTPPEYEMPSGRKERLVSRVLALDFLCSAGVPSSSPPPSRCSRSASTSSSASASPPTTSPTTPLLLACSLRKNVIPVLSYLEKLGVTRARLAAFVRAYPACLHASVAVDLSPVVKALRGLDVDRQDIPRVLERYPDVLGLKPGRHNQHLRRLPRRHRRCGATRHRTMVTHYPFFLGMRVGTIIKPILEKRPYILGYDLEGTVKPNVEALLSFGVQKEALPLVIAQGTPRFSPPKQRSANQRKVQVRAIMGNIMGKKVVKVAISLLLVLALLLQPCAAARPIAETPTIDGSRSLHPAAPVAFDGDGAGPYSGVSDGRVLKWNGPVRGLTTYAYGPGYDARACTASRTRPAEVTESRCGRPLGLRFHDGSGNLYIADAYKGLMRVAPGGGKATVLVNKVDGVPLRFTNGVDVDQVTGEVFFTDSSMNYQRSQHERVTATGDSTGRLMKYDPQNNSVTVLQSGITYPNGIAISADRTHLVVALTGPCKLMRYWIKGSKMGTSEILADLPGYPDNVRADGKGGFWVALHREKMELPFGPDVHLLAVRINADGRRETD